MQPAVRAERAVLARHVLHGRLVQPVSGLRIKRKSIVCFGKYATIWPIYHSFACDHNSAVKAETSKYHGRELVVMACFA